MSVIEKAIEVLKAENELMLLDIITGEVKTYDYLNEFNQDCYTGHIVAISALEKQVPKKLEYVDNMEIWMVMAYCPKCKHEFKYEDFGTNYCSNCGQSLDWND